MTTVQPHTELTRAWGIRLAPRRSRRFWDILQNFPRFTDFRRKMPHLNGIELCQVVRNDPLWSELPVLFSPPTPKLCSQIFAAGADCVCKPIVGTKLVTRIFNRLERTQLPGGWLKLTPDRAANRLNQLQELGLSAASRAP